MILILLPKTKTHYYWQTQIFRLANSKQNSFKENNFRKEGVIIKRLKISERTEK